MILNWKLFLETVGEVPINDIQSYIDGMGTTYKDKLFFMSKISPDVIVDFGCANGFILSKIKEANPTVNIIGYDLDESMLVSAKSLLGDDVLLTSNWSVVQEDNSPFYFGIGFLGGFGIYLTLNPEDRIVSFVGSQKSNLPDLTKNDLIKSNSLLLNLSDLYFFCNSYLFRHSSPSNSSTPLIKDS